MREGRSCPKLGEAESVNALQKAMLAIMAVVALFITIKWIFLVRRIRNFRPIVGPPPPPPDWQPDPVPEAPPEGEASTPGTEAPPEGEEPTADPPQRDPG